MSEIRNVMFVCTGNICRSAMAEQLLRHMAAARGLNLEVRSCGIAAEGWFTVPEPIHRLVAKSGAPAFEHKARLATREQLRWADMILAMTEDHVDHLMEQFPEFASRTRLLREQAGFGAEDVEDPMGGTEETYTRCYEVLNASLKALLDRSFRDPDEP